MKRRRVLRWGYGLAGVGLLMLVMFGFSAVENSSSKTGLPAGASVAEEADGRVQIGPSADTWVVPAASGETVLRIEFAKVDSVGGYGRATAAQADLESGEALSIGEATVQGEQPWGEVIAGFEEQLENQARTNPYRPTVDVPLVSEKGLAGERTDLRVSTDIEYPVVADESGATLNEITSDDFTIKKEQLDRTVHLIFEDPEKMEDLASADTFRSGSSEMWAVLGTALLALSVGVGLVLWGRKLSPF